MSKFTILFHLFIFTHFFGLSLCWKWKKCQPQDCEGKPGCVTISQHRDFSGWSQCINFEKQNECVTFDKWWQEGRLSSIDSHKGCVRLYKEKNCNGISLDFSSNSGLSYNNLDKVDFEDVALSASLCSRPHNEVCNITRLFPNGIIPTENIINEIDELFSHFAWNKDKTNSSIVTLDYLVLNPLLRAVNYFARHLFIPNQNINRQVNDVTSNSMSQLNLKFQRIKSLLESAQNNGNETTKDVKIGYILTATYKCEEIAQLFKDEEYPFIKNKVVFAPFLVPFSAIYFSIAKLTFLSNPNQRKHIKNRMAELTKLNRVYLEGAKRNRRNLLDCTKPKILTETFCYGYCHVSMKAGRVRDAFYPNYNFYKNSPNTSSIVLPSPKHFNWKSADEWDCHRCLAKARNSVDYKMDAFFHNVISKLSNFYKSES